MVVDYRWLNECTLPDAYPLPLIDDILCRQGKNRVWTVLDMKHGYHQMPLAPEARPLTTMSIPGKGLYQWKVMPMGVRNGNAQFQRMMEWVLKDLPFADVYVDDVIIGSTGVDEQDMLANHARHVEQVLELFAKHDLVAKLSKASFFSRSVEFCGQILEGGRRRPQPGKLDAIQRWELPQTLTELRGFLGVANYYSSYLKDYAQVAGPLMDLLKVPKGKSKGKDAKRLVWCPVAEEAFRATKRLLAERLELFIVEPDRPFHMETDASDFAIGATLKQMDDDGSRTGTPGAMYPVAFFSRKLQHSQQNWSAREKEAYAIVSSLE